MVASCFVMFLIMVKPAAPSVVTAPSKPAHCKFAPSRELVCPSEPDWRER
jgi:hypothetical protein